jgi:hypothetical protein
MVLIGLIITGVASALVSPKCRITRVAFNTKHFKTKKNEMVQGPSARLGLHETMLTVDHDKLTQLLSSCTEY